MRKERRLWGYQEPRPLARGLWGTSGPAGSSRAAGGTQHCCMEAASLFTTSVNSESEWFLQPRFLS